MVRYDGALIFLKAVQTFMSAKGTMQKCINIFFMTETSLNELIKYAIKQSGFKATRFDVSSSI